MLAGSVLAGICAVALLGQPVQGAGNTYYVSPTGSDSSTGSSTAPFRQIRKALAVVKAGDTVYVADGSYLGFNADSLNGTAAAPITIKAQGSGVQVTPTTDRSDNRDNVSINDSSYLVFDGINSSNATRAAVRINTCNHITVRNGVYGNNVYWGIFTGHSDDLLLEYNECFGSQIQHGIYTSNSGDRPIVRFNRLHDNANCGLHMNGDVSELPGDGIISGAVIEGNVIYNNGATGGSAINMDGVQDSIVRNNLLYNNHGHGIDGYQIDGAQGPKGLKILNNTVSMASDGNWAIQLTETAGMNLVRNNILYHPNASRGGVLCGGDPDVANVDSDYNMMDRATPDGPAISLAEWQTLGEDAHSTTIGSKTLFVNAAAGDFHLAAGSAAIDKGATLADVTQDLEKNPRPNGAAYDLGAYEIAGGTPPPPPAPPAAPTSLTATPGKLQVTLSWPSGADASGYEVERQDPGAAFARVAITSTGSYTDTGLLASTTYVYRVRATNSGGTSAYSPTASATTLIAVPTAPASLTATAGSGQVSLSWSASTNAATYQVDRKDPGGAFTKLVILSTTNYTDTGLLANTTYSYRVRASNTSGNSTYSPTATATTLAAVPTTPTAPGSLTATAGSGQVGLSWAASTGATSYNVERQDPGAAFTRVATVSGASYTDTGVLGNTTYVYRVSASNSGGTSGYSPTASATTPTTTYTVSGTVTVGTSGVGGVVVAGGAASTVTAADGTYTLTGFAPGNYGIVASTATYKFPVQTALLGPSKTGVNFTAPAGTDIGVGGSYTISGKVVVNGFGLGGAVVAGGAASTVTAADGSYTLTGFSAGNYGILASAPGCNFPMQVATVGPSKTGVDFVIGSYIVSGKVTAGGVPLAGVLVAGGAATTFTAADGTYTLTGFTAGNYGIMASAPGYSFPVQVVNLGPSRTGVDFSTTSSATSTYTVSGKVTVGGVGVGGVLVAGGASSTFTAADGSYTLSGFPAGRFGVLATAAGYTFPMQVVSVGPSQSGVNFAGQ